MKPTPFGQLANTFTPKKPTTKAKCEHQAKMELVIKAGYAPKLYLARWGKWIKQSGINDIDLKRIIGIAESLPDPYSPRGFVRKRLINKDWTKYF